MAGRREVGLSLLGAGGLVGAGVTYVANFPAVVSLACLVAAAAAGLAWSAPWWAVRYRFLLVVYTPMLLLAAWELDGQAVVARDAQQEIYVRGRVNYADVMITLYPRREAYRFLKGQQLGLCRNPDLAEQSALCRELGPIQLSRVRQEFERALRSGVTSNANLLRIYVEVLKESGAPAHEIAEARARLRRHHPKPAHY